MKLHRLGEHSGATCPNGHSCPQVLLDETGDFVIVGEDVTADVITSLPAGPGIGTGEKAIRIPRKVLLNARVDTSTI